MKSMDEWDDKFNSAKIDEQIEHLRTPASSNRRARGAEYPPTPSSRLIRDLNHLFFEKEENQSDDWSLMRVWQRISSNGPSHSPDDLLTDEWPDIETTTGLFRHNPTPPSSPSSALSSHYHWTG